MEEDNPWLDPDSVKHVNKKSVKPEVVKIISVKSEEKKIDEKKIDEKKLEEKNSETKTVTSTLISETSTVKSREISERDKIDLEKVPHGLISVSSILKTDEKISKFLEVLISEFTTNLPEASKKWAIDNFGEDWLRVFLKDVEYLQSDLKTSKFFPSQDKMIFLKYIFLLQQSI